MSADKNHDIDERGVEDHDRGLSLDLPTILSRRRLLGLLGVAGAATLAGCATQGSDSATPGTSTSAASPSASASASSAALAAGTEIPEETSGPFPGDGSNGVNVLARSGIVRSDIRSSFGTGSATADGVPLTIKLTVYDTSGTVKPLTGAAVYLWHCDRDGQYSLYAQNIRNENYLRGVQETDAAGAVTFTSIFPAAYDGRWPHIHFEVYPSLAKATTASDKLRTSQLALPAEACTLVYATTGYERSVSNLARTSLGSDMVFRDGYSLQLGTVTGAVDSGMTVSLNVPV
jgi:protocatechuate 3,4-dioxygenase beta subunit